MTVEQFFIACANLDHDTLFRIWDATDPAHLTMLFAGTYSKMHGSVREKRVHSFDIDSDFSGVIINVVD